VDFDDNASLDTSQVQDARGRGGFGGGRGLAVGGGGGISLLGLVLYLVFGGGGGGGTSDGPGLSQPAELRNGQAHSVSDLSTRCRTGADADRDEDCRVVGIVNSVQAYWSQSFSASSRRYTAADTQLFSGSTSTGCGSATSAVGPFYCPADDTVYIDLGFFDELRTTYGASGGPFAQAYVLAHEYGHHTQDLLGTSAQAQRGSQQGATSASVRLELQADCYAGAWASHAQDSGFLTFTEADVRDGLSAAAAVGDDRIQQKARGRVDPESFTHGTAAQRQKWFLIGLRSGSPAQCDTFAGAV
jgi:uncharacterized protein